MYLKLMFLQAATQYAVEDKIIEITGKRVSEIRKKIQKRGEEAEYKKWHTDGFKARVIIGPGKGTIRFFSREFATAYAKNSGIPVKGKYLTPEDLWN